MITLGDFATEIGLDRSTARKAILKLQIKTGRTYLAKGRVSGKQRGWVLTRADADEVLNLRAQEGYVVGDHATAIVKSAGVPTVYVLGLHGGRLKIGFSDSFDQRLASHRTLVPDLAVLRRWALAEAYELVMIDIARQQPTLERIASSEVFQAADKNAIEALLGKLDALAAVGASRVEGDEPKIS
jgi:hypothetical protein